MTAFYEIIALFSTADNRRSSDQIHSVWTEETKVERHALQTETPIWKLFAG